MFIYQNKENSICITFKDNKPVEFPEYVIEFKDGKLVINGDEITGIEAIKLEEDLVKEVCTEITSEVIIDLNGYTISNPTDKEGLCVYKVQEGGKLVINGDGIIDGTADNDYSIALWARGGDIVINGGTITNEGITGEDEHYDLVYASKGGIIEINGGTFKAKTPQWTLNNLDSDPGQFIVKGGRFYQFDPSNTKTEPTGANNNFVAEGYKVIQDGDWYEVVKA